MLHLFELLGSFIRHGIAVGFAAFWGLSSVVLDGARFSDLRLLGTTGMVLLISLAGAAIMAGFYALVVFLRDHRPLAKAETAPEPNAFDPDAIIARHLAQRPPRLLPVPHRPLGAANSFGRKLA